MSLLLQFIMKLVTYTVSFLFPFLISYVRTRWNRSSHSISLSPLFFFIFGSIFVFFFAIQRHIHMPTRPVYQWIFDSSDSIILTNQLILNLLITINQRISTSIHSSTDRNAPSLEYDNQTDRDHPFETDALPVSFAAVILIIENTLTLHTPSLNYRYLPIGFKN